MAASNRQLFMAWAHHRNHRQQDTRFQLCLALELHSMVGSTTLEAFDPIFTEVDKDVLEKCGVHVLTNDEGSRKRVKQMTMFYMPHCEAHLCERLLEANWSPTSLAKLVIIGNSFGHYHLLWDCAPFPQGYDRPSRMIGLVVEGAVTQLPLEEMDMAAAAAFNDTSIHTFDLRRLQALPQLFGQ
eukprot:evm.model.scf_1305.5 EVM.evm.TU.scf_1305.5   scf_1305:21044-23221(+)